MIVRSIDDLSTFKQIINTLKRNSTNAFANDGTFNWVNCYQNTCVAAGTYSDSNGISRPLLAYSTDKGLTWTYPSDITNVNFTPAGTMNPFSNNGYFGASAVTSISSIMPQRLRFLFR